MSTGFAFSAWLSYKCADVRTYDIGKSLLVKSIVTHIKSLEIHWKKTFSYILQVDVRNYNRFFSKISVVFVQYSLKIIKLL